MKFDQKKRDAQFMARRLPKEDSVVYSVYLFADNFITKLYLYEIYYKIYTIDCVLQIRLSNTMSYYISYFVTLSIRGNL